MDKGPSEQIQPDDEIWEALARHMAGESSPEESARVKKWLAEGTGRADLLAILDRSMAALPNAADVDVEAALQKVKASRFEERTHPSWRTNSWRIAAGVMLVLGASLIWKASEQRRSSSAVASARNYETQVGETDSVYLADGSLVVLGPQSHLKLSAGYGRKDREVELNGEALFDVRHDANRRFSVRAGNATIHDIGTTFAVRSNPGEAVAIVVTVGSVLLHETGKAESDGVVLRAGDRGSLSINGEVVADSGAVTQTDLVWIQGRLVFDDASLDHVAKQLKRWYGVDLQVADASLKERHITASFKGEPVEEVLNVLALTLGAHIDRNGKTAIVRAQR
jgi:transmembrane sensor